MPLRHLLFPFPQTARLTRVLLVPQRPCIGQVRRRSAATDPAVVCSTRILFLGEDARVHDMLLHRIAPVCLFTRSLHRFPPPPGPFLPSLRQEENDPPDRGAILAYGELCAEAVREASMRYLFPGASVKQRPPLLSSARAPPLMASCEITPASTLVHAQNGVACALLPGSRWQGFPHFLQMGMLSSRVLTAWVPRLPPSRGESKGPLLLL